MSQPLLSHSFPPPPGGRVVRLRQPGVYVWEAPAKALRIQLPLDVVTRLERDAIAATAAVMSKGVEIGGLLLGTFGSDTISISDYVLAGEDRERLRAAAGRFGGLVVGFFRSNVRPKLLFDSEDASVADELFLSPRQVFLLVKPAAGGSRAGFFFREGDTIRPESYLEFPFRAAQLAEGIAAGEAAPSAPRPQVVPLLVKPAPPFAPSPVEREPLAMEEAPDGNPSEPQDELEPAAVEEAPAEGPSVAPVEPEPLAVEEAPAGVRPETRPGGSGKKLVILETAVRKSPEPVCRCFQSPCRREIVGRRYSG